MKPKKIHLIAVFFAFGAQLSGGDDSNYEGCKNLGSTQNGICLASNDLGGSDEKLDEAYSALKKYLQKRMGCDKGLMNELYNNYLNLREPWNQLDSAECQIDLFIDRTGVGFPGEIYSCVAEKKKAHISYLESAIFNVDELADELGIQCEGNSVVVP